MKKLLTFAALLAFGISFVGCAESTPTKPATPTPPVTTGAEEGAKTEATEEKKEEAAPAGEKAEEAAPTEKKEGE